MTPSSEGNSKPAAPSHLAIIGAGATTLYLLRNLLDHIDALPIRRITVFERNTRPGVGMPYNPETTDHTNLCNISSVEIPRLDAAFADWLRTLDETTLASFELTRQRVSDSETYPRILLGRYFEAQFYKVVDGLIRAGVAVELRLGGAVRDVRDVPERDCVEVMVDGAVKAVDAVAIATGHSFGESDVPEAGYFASPWPIQKLLPQAGEHFDFTVGTLGASLSAFDVVAALAERHGRFERIDEDGEVLRFVGDPAAPAFGFALHSAEGWLPHLQYEQAEPMREMYRHVDRATLLGLRDEHGLLRLETYFDKVCRPTLAKALHHDGLTDAAQKLDDGTWELADFVREMEDDHTYADAFEGMRSELPEARQSLERERPIRWKETLDDLMYMLNFHAELMPAEDHQRWHKLVMPFLMNVIAAMPLRSARRLLALHEAGRLTLITGKVKVTEKSNGRTTVEVDDDGAQQTCTYRMFVDCSGQPPVKVEAYPFRTLVDAGTVRAGQVRRVDGGTESIAGIDVDRGYRVIGRDGKPNPRVLDISFAHAAGLRPYSYGLQACNETARLAVAGWLGA